MKTITLEKRLERTRENKDFALEVFRNIHKSNFSYGDRAFDKPRKNPEKEKVLRKLERHEFG